MALIGDIANICQGKPRTSTVRSSAQKTSTHTRTHTLLVHSSRHDLLHNTQWTKRPPRHPPVNVVLEVVLEVPRPRQHQRHGLHGRGGEPQQSCNLHSGDVQGLRRQDGQAAERVSHGLVLVAEVDGRQGEAVAVAGVGVAVTQLVVLDPAAPPAREIRQDVIRNVLT